MGVTLTEPRPTRAHHNPDTHLHLVDCLRRGGLYSDRDFELFVFDFAGDTWASDRYVCVRVSDIEAMIGDRIPDKKSGVRPHPEGMEVYDVSGWALHAMSGIAHGGDFDTYWSRVTLLTGPARHGADEGAFRAMFASHKTLDFDTAVGTHFQIIAAQNDWETWLAPRGAMFRLYDQHGMLRVLGATIRPRDYAEHFDWLPDVTRPAARHALVDVARQLADERSIAMPKAIQMTAEYAKVLQPVTAEEAGR